MDRKGPVTPMRKRTAFDKLKKSQRKEGMQLEKDVVKQWNDGMNRKRKSTFDTKKTLSEEFFGDDEELEVETKNHTISKTTLTQHKKKQSMVGKSSKNEARQVANSGAGWSQKGDVVLEHALLEIKHRGSVNSKGKATISIPKEWLDKQKKEAAYEGKDFWYLPFAYKSDRNIYLIKDFEHEIQMVREMRELSEENERLKQLLESAGLK